MPWSEHRFEGKLGEARGRGARLRRAVWSSRSRVAVVDSIVLGSRGVEFPLLRKPVPRTRGGDPR